MRYGSLKKLLLVLGFLLIALPVCAQTPAAVQTCKKANGGTAIQNYTVTIGSSGGSTGCTSNYTVHNAIFLAYDQLSGTTDRTTANLSTTGATITWHKADSIQNNIFAPPGYFTGIFYACWGDITSPTNSIAITLDMGASMAGFTVLYAQEVKNIVQTNCLDTHKTANTCCNAAQFATPLSGTLASSSEYAFATALTVSGTNPVLAAGSGGACASSCFSGGFNTIPAQGIDNQSTTSTAVESVAVTSTVSSTWAFNQSTAGLAQNIVGATFLAGPPPVSGRHQLLEN